MEFNNLGGEVFSSPDVENLLKSRYFLKNEKTWDDVAKRVSCILPEIYPYIRDQYFCPSTPTLFNLNTKGERNGTLSSCFTMGIEDSIEGIFDALKECAVVTKAAGGVGYVFDLRSRNEVIKSLNRDSSGPLPFIKIFNSVLDGISQAGARKGAGMAQLRVDHPEILYFIDAKKDYKNQDFARFNFSIRVPDWFCKKLDEEPNSVMMVRNVVDGKEIELEECGKKITVGELWNRIIHNSWLSAEPGLFFDSIAFDRSTVTHLNKTISSNPCCFAKSKDVWVITEHCYKEIKTITKDDLIWVDTAEAWAKTSGYFSSGIATVYDVIFDGKYPVESIRITNNHKLLVLGVNGQEDTFMELKDIKIGDCIVSNMAGLTNAKKSLARKIIDIKLVGEEEVGCIEVEKYHQFTANGIISGNSEFISIPYASCNLASINLTKFVKTSKSETGVSSSYFDFEAFEKLIELATIYLNKIIDNNKFPLKKIEEVTKKTRPIGLGFMGLAHALYLLEIPFASPEGSKFIDDISNILTLKSLETSVELAKKEGSYPAYDESLFLKANERIFTKNKRGEDLKKSIVKYGIRNHATTSIAPTGSISFLYNCSSGLEPVFSLAYIRKIEKLNKKYEEVYIADRFFDRYLDVYYPKDKEKILKNVVDNDGSCQKCDILSNKEKAIFITAKDMTPMQHLESLAIVSNNITFAASKTVNLPKEATEEEVGEIYRKAHKMGCIGVTVYRDGCREGILVSANKEAAIDKLPRTRAPKRPQSLKGKIFAVQYKKEKLYVAIGFWSDGKVYEVFAGPSSEPYVESSGGNIIKNGRGKYSFVTDDGISYCLSNGKSDENANAICRISSAALRHGCDSGFLVHQLEKTEGDLTSFAKVISRVLKKFVKDGTEVSGEECPECKGKLRRIDGCRSCVCGWSACS